MVSLKRFDPRMMANDAVVLIIGRRRTGKSWIARDILYHKQKIPVGLAMSGTEDGNGFYRKYIPDVFVYSGFNADALRKLLKRQKRMVNKNEPCPSAFVVLDDCAYDKKMFSGDTPLREMFFNGRHWKLFSMITLQYIMDMPPDLRQNIDYVIVLKDNILKNLKKLHECFFGVIDEFGVFVEIMKQMTEDHGALVLDNTSNSNDLSSMLFWYKAKERSFRMGTAEYWQMHNRKYNPTHGDGDQEADEDTLLKPKKKTNIVVTKA